MQLKLPEDLINLIRRTELQGTQLRLRRIIIISVDGKTLVRLLRFSCGAFVPEQVRDPSQGGNAVALG